MNKACVMSGYCCTTAPCVYGLLMDDKQKEMKDEIVSSPVNKTECLHLLPPNHMGQRYVAIKSTIKISSQSGEYLERWCDCYLNYNNQLNVGNHINIELDSASR